MSEARVIAPPAPTPQVPLALKRRVKQGIVVSYLRELSKAATARERES